MAEINDLNIVDASNTLMPENQAPSTVNDDTRAIQGIIARWNKDTDGSVASTGSANAYVMAANQTLSAYYDGLTVTFDANFTNTGAATLNVDAVSADAIRWPDGTLLIGGEIAIGAKITVRHDGAIWQLVSGATRGPLLQTEANLASTARTFTGIPTWANKLTLTVKQGSTDGTSIPIVQLGDSGGIETTGYLGSAVTIGASVSNFTNGFGIASNWAATNVFHGSMIITKHVSADHEWVAQSTFSLSDSAGVFLGSGSKLVTVALDRVSITTQGGSDSFDGGKVNLLIE